MPKKRQGKALLIKPGSSASTCASSSRHDESVRPSVNDLIRESRRLQLKNEPAVAANLASSVPPQVREALSLPTPEAPIPRQGARTGPSRLRRIPGPPPPRSWLTDSQHAPAELRNNPVASSRFQKKTSSLPGASFPNPASLQHMALKDLTRNWNAHAEYYHVYLADLPVKMREALLSYLAVYNDDVRINPLRLLFLTDLDPESRAEVTRLDLSDAIGDWTSLKQLERDLGPALSPQAQPTNTGVPDAWDRSSSGSDTGAIARVPSGEMFKNLQHLSLALQPGKTASWRDLVRLCEKVPTITSLSLAHWPQPTYTPRAASTRIVVKSGPSRPGTVYGGSNLYTAFDNDWREAAGILRSLSRILYCLKWLDLTGCGPWLGALTWKSEDDEENVVPEWNGWWRGIEYMCLAVGWKPASIPPEMELLDGHDVEMNRRMHLHRKEKEEHAALRRSAESVAQDLRALRKAGGGRWIHFEF